MSKLRVSIVLLFALLITLFFFSPQIQPQSYFLFSNPDPDAEDLALFHRATRTTPHLFTLKNPKPKIAFLFLTNTNFTFAPLWEIFFTGNNHLFNIYIHADPVSSVLSPGGVFHQNHFIPSKTTQRASPTLIAAARRLLATALLDDPHNQYFALVSQHCIPLFSFRFVYNSLFEYRVESLNKYKIQHPSFIEFDSKHPNLYQRYNARGKDVMMPEVSFKDFRKGSQFFILNRKHAKVVLRDQKLWKKFRIPCIDTYSCYPEEHYFPTLLSMEERDGCTGFTLTRVNWTGCTDGHPHLYTREEVSPELVRQLRKSNSSYPYLFARKFSPETLAPLMDIAYDVIFRD
ncbi:putative glycosyl transferase, family 14 [Medicago truncatula]|uniref:Core-2/I-branching enzyme n=1 Tax=Medicago truncatula TaxID=3880 RepID=A0A072VT63_MEDTR|nr:glycosyltransferase BC10 [Medicago truncatula]KEH41305.1 core-2/I-branching enzyme [Medicago truncatula]RHN78825.1 putative glycosyl transferase, family 14 [Medicago truncatula]